MSMGCDCKFICQGGVIVSLYVKGCKFICQGGVIVSLYVKGV